ncbi:MAG: C/D box methylation guide ribonucleoprotein complex aNOP56 subunit [Candidatus Helarchaeales archaeon]
MIGYFVHTMLGNFVLDESGNEILVSNKFSTDLNDVAEVILNLEQEGKLKNKEELIEQIVSAGITRLIVEDAETYRLLRDSRFEIVQESPSSVGKKIRGDLPAFARKVGSEIKDIKAFQRDLNFLITKRKIKHTAEGVEGKDKLIIQAIETIDQLDKTINILVSRLREWYGLHFPELDKKVSNHQRYLKYAQLRRSQFDEKTLQQIGISRETAIKAVQLAKNSMGSNLGDLDFKAIQSFARRIQDLYALRSELAQYVEALMKVVAPNINGIVGPLLGARLISLGGGLSTLATKPSSTMQILGAERALFRSLKTGAKPPKHGIIFQWEPVHSSKWWLRGKIARALASKLTIAARVDAYSGEYIADNLLRDLKNYINSLMEKYKTPPKKKKEKKKEVKKKRRKQRSRRKKKEAKK